MHFDREVNIFLFLPSSNASTAFIEIFCFTRFLLPIVGCKDVFFKDNHHTLEIYLLFDFWA